MILDVKPIPLPLREWLELGQAMTDLHRMGPKFFRKWHTQRIAIGSASFPLKVGRKTYRGPAIFYLDETLGRRK